MMIRPFTRVLSAAVVVLALALILAAPVQARPLDTARRTAKVSASFLDGALNWFTGLLTGKTPTSPTSSEKATKPTGGTTIGGGATYTPNTGVCIDPLGSPCVLFPTS